MVSKEFTDFINETLPIEGEWFEEGNADVFHETTKTLLSRGLREDLIKQIFLDLYGAVASEFGH